MTEEVFEYNMNRIVQGDQEGLREIYDAYISYIFSIVYNVLQNKENAEDVTSEFFLKIWRIADRYQAGNGHRTWLATIARNMAIDYLRKNKHEVATEEIFEEADSEESSVEQQVIGDMNMQRALSMLNENERQVVTMKIALDMTFQEISNALGVPMGTITWRYQNAIKKLRRLGYE